MSFLSALRLVDKSILTLLICEGNSPDDKEHALETECDEYIFKPVVPKELKMRLNALSKKDKRYESDDIGETYKLGQSTVDFKKRLFTTNNIQVSLTRKEAALLKLLLFNKNKLVSHEFILGEIWNTGNYYASKSMVVYINKLRKKIKGDPSIFLINLHGSGYILKETVLETASGN
jgi:DNA-binding response OmpR family regulator